MPQTDGALMLFRGKQVPEPAGIWACYYISWSDRQPNSPTIRSLSPTYGSIHDVEKWITEDYEITPRDIETFLEQATLGAMEQAFYFNTYPKTKAGTV
jgi:hypothetical protein